MSAHAARQMRRRNIPEAAVRKVLKNPDQRLPTPRPGRDVLQSVLFFGARPYLIRVFVDDGAMPTVVTVYRTSKIGKYIGDPQ